jgi:RNA-binding protein 26
MRLHSTELIDTHPRSDADADVLADYVLALLRHDGDIDTVRRLCEEEIPDFLKEGTTAP